MPELRLIDLELIDDHPRNPRVAMRQDVIDGIAENLNGEFPKQHALRVRTVGDRFEIISGHHRKAGALKAKLKAVWCWVEELDDEAAFMELVTSNNQGELDPLEIGIHAFEAVPVAKGGRGKKGGGVGAYAARVGRAKSTLTELRNAGEVIVNCSVNRTVYMGKSQHLAAIHKLNRECWQEACEWLAKSTESVKDVQARVELAKGEESHTRQIALFLKKTTARELERIDEIYSRVLEELSVVQSLADEWVEWFELENPLDVKVIQAKRIEFEDRLAELTEEPPPERPNLVLADPPWKYDFAETDNRQVENQYPTATVSEIIDMEPETETDCVLFLWATVAKLTEALEVMDGWGFQYKTHAVWDKGKIGMGYWFRGQHELLLVGTKGQFSPPETDQRVSSVFNESRASKHSKKPECVYKWIESAFPEAKKLEMFCREPRKGWEVFGNEA